MEFIIAKNLPFNTVEDHIFRKGFKYPSISTKVLQKYMNLIQKKIIANQLPELFGMVFDGWFRIEIQLLTEIVPTLYWHSSPSSTKIGTLIIVSMPQLTEILWLKH